MLRPQPRRAAHRVAAAALPEADRTHRRPAGREADRLSHAADDAEGEVLRPRTAATSAWPRTATRTSRRRFAATRTSWCTGRCARHVTRRCRRSRPTRRARTCRRLPVTPPRWSGAPSDAERELLQWKKVKFMADKVGDEFEGYVTGVAAFGLFAELVEHYVEGLIHISTMADDYYRFVETAHMLRGENTQQSYRLGDKVMVRGAARQHGRAADRTRARGYSRAGECRGAGCAALVCPAEGRSGEGDGPEGRTPRNQEELPARAERT